LNVSEGVEGPASGCDKLETKQRTWRTWGRLFRIAFLPIMVVIFGSMAVPVLAALHLDVTLAVFAVVALSVA